MDEALEKFKQEVQSAEMNVNDRAASTYHIVREMAQYLIAKEEQAMKTSIDEFFIGDEFEPFIC